MLKKEEFYPTPVNMAKEMFSLIDDTASIKTVLEPSAGKGDLIDAFVIYHKTFMDKKYEDIMKKHGVCGSRNEEKGLEDIDCIEKDNELSMILKGKGYRIVGDDFLSFNTYKSYDLILMNPPFSDGDKHLLKAIRMTENSGGQIVCLLNAETIRNPYSVYRKDLLSKIESYGGQIKFIENGFSEAERKTDVETAIVSINIQKRSAENLWSDLKKKHYARMEEKSERESTSSLTVNDYVRSVVAQFNLEVEAGLNLIRAYRAMDEFMLKTDAIDKGQILNLSVEKEGKAEVNAYVKAVRYKYWNKLFNSPVFTGNMTSNQLQEYRNKVKELEDYDFSVYNIRSIQAEMCKNIVHGIDDCIIELFDTLTIKHNYDEFSKNIHYYNGWKTNKSWFINKKVILPMRAWSIYTKAYRPYDYDIVRKLEDIEKALAYLKGDMKTIDIREALLKAEKEEQTKNIDLTYISITFHKKGTCHIVFKDQELLKKLNIFGSCQKGWLPPSYGKKAYEDMDAEEKAVIDSFEGKSSYNTVYSKRTYYMAGARDVTPLLTA